MTGARVALLLADSHTTVPSEAVSSGLAVWWVLVVLAGLLSIASASGFALYLRRTSPARAFAAADTPDEPPHNRESLQESP